MIGFFKTVIYTPLYNTLVYLIDIVPGGDVGLAIILLTLIVRCALLPVSLKAARTQRLIKKMEPHVATIKEKHKDNSEEQMKQILALYKERGFNPFLNFALVLVQLPIIFALYFVFYKGGLPVIHPELLYSFVPLPSPDQISVHFLNILDVTSRNVVLALAAGITQFFLFRLTFPTPAPLPKNPSMADEMKRNLSVQMRYIFPVIVTGIAYSISAAIALYWVTSNLFSIGQELYVRRRLDHEEKKEQDIANEGTGTGTIAG